MNLVLFGTSKSYSDSAVTIIFLEQSPTFQLPIMSDDIILQKIFISNSCDVWGNIKIFTYFHFTLRPESLVGQGQANLTFACCLVVDRHNYGILGFLRTLSHIFSCHTHFIHKLAVHKLAGPQLALEGQLRAQKVLY